MHAECSKLANGSFLVQTFRPRVLNKASVWAQPDATGRSGDNETVRTAPADCCRAVLSWNET